MSKASDAEKYNFIQMLTAMDKEQMAEFIKAKGHEPKIIKPFIRLKNTNKKEKLYGSCKSC